LKVDFKNLVCFAENAGKLLTKVFGLFLKDLAYAENVKAEEQLLKLQVKRIVKFATLNIFGNITV